MHDFSGGTQASTQPSLDIAVPKTHASASRQTASLHHSMVHGSYPTSNSSTDMFVPGPQLNSASSLDSRRIPLDQAAMNQLGTSFMSPSITAESGVPDTSSRSRGK